MLKHQNSMQQITSDIYVYQILPKLKLDDIISLYSIDKIHYQLLNDEATLKWLSTKYKTSKVENFDRFLKVHHETILFQVLNLEPINKSLASIFYYNTNDCCTIFNCIMPDKNSPGMHIKHTISYSLNYGGTYEYSHKSSPIPNYSVLLQSKKYCNTETFYCYDFTTIIFGLMNLGYPSDSISYVLGVLSDKFFDLSRDQLDIIPLYLFLVINLYSSRSTDNLYRMITRTNTHNNLNTKHNIYIDNINIYFNIDRQIPQLKELLRREIKNFMQ